MKRFVALLLSLCLMTASCAFAAQDYTVAEKLMKQLWAGSGFSGTLTVEMAAQDGQKGLETLKPIVVEADYIYVRPTEEDTAQHRLDLRLMDGEAVQTAAAVQLKDDVLSFQSGLTGESWYALSAGKKEQGAALNAAMQDAAAATGAPALAQAACTLLTAVGSMENAEEWMIPYTTRLDIWMEGYRQEAVLGKTADGTTTMQASYVIPPAAIRAQVKQLVYDLLSDSAALTALTDALGEDAAQLYLNPALQDWYFRAVDALPLNGDLTISRTVSFKGETLDLRISLPMVDAQAGEATFTYARTQGEEDLPGGNVIELQTTDRTLALTWQEYSSMTGVKVLQGVVESKGAQDFSVSDEENADWAVNFTLKKEETTSKDLENRDVYAYNLSLTLGEATEITLNSRFVSKELKSAATDVQAELTISGEETVVQMLFEGASRKKWEPQEIPMQRTNLSAGEAAEAMAAAFANALLLLKDTLVLPESTH